MLTRQCRLCSPASAAGKAWAERFPHREGSDEDLNEWRDLEEPLLK